MWASKEAKLTQPVNIGPQDVQRTPPSNVPKTSPKDPIWPSLGRPNLTSWGRPKMTSRGRSDLTFNGRLWEVDSGRSQDVLRTSLRGPSKHSNFDVPKCLPKYSKIFFQNFMDWPNLSNLKAFQHSRCIENPVKLLRWNIFCETS